MNQLTKIPTNHIIIRKRLAEEQARIKEVQKRDDKAREYLGEVKNKLIKFNK
jgi:hypothetical protein